MKKEDLFAKLRKNTAVQYGMPDMNINALTYEDVKKQFIDMSVAVGGNVRELNEGEDINAVIRECYPDAKVFASNVPGIQADINPDDVDEAKDLNGTDVGIVKGKIGVAENGCVWIPQTMKEKAICFISEYLVIILDKNSIVNNMHEAYPRIEMTDYNFGSFISGPSKTADIEQALVMGAQAARGVTVLLV